MTIVKEGYKIQVVNIDSTLLGEIDLEKYDLAKFAAKDAIIEEIRHLINLDDGLVVDGD